MGPPTTDGSCADALTLADGVPAELVTLAHDPQTSGGLLAAIDLGSIDEIECALDAVGVSHWRIGRVEAATTPAVALV